MSEIALLIIKVVFLALLWLFILSVVSVIRSDLFGKTVRASDQPQPQELETPRPPPRKAKRQRGEPRVLMITQGNQAGRSADLALSRRRQPRSRLRSFRPHPRRPSFP